MKKGNTSEDTKKRIIGDLDLVDQSIIIRKGIDSRNKSTKGKAREQFDKYADDAAVNELRADGTPRYTKAEYSALSDDDKIQARAESFGYRSTKRLEDATDTFINNLESIVKNEEGVFDSKLANIASVKQIAENVGIGDQEIMKAYGAFNGARNAIKDLKEKKAIDIEQKERLRDIISEASGIDQYQKHIKAGYSDELAKAAAEIAKLKPSENLSVERLVQGAEKVADRAKKNLVRVAGKDYEQKVAKAVYGSLKTMASSGDKESEDMATRIYFLSQRGYELGERPFKEAYKPKDKK